MQQQPRGDIFGIYRVAAPAAPAPAEAAPTPVGLKPSPPSWMIAPELEKPPAWMVAPRIFIPELPDERAPFVIP
jgi:hypothetical protein